MVLQFSVQGLLGFAAWCVLLLWASHMARVFRQKQIDIIGKRNWFFVFSGVLILLGIVAFAHPKKGLKLGLDFKGGTLLERAFSREVTSEQVRQAISEAVPSLKEALVQVESKLPEFGQKEAPKTLVLVRSQTLTQNEIDAVDGSLKKRFGEVEVRQSQTIGPTIGRELQKNAVTALAIALVLQLIYIAVRFGWNFNYGFAADLALLHDVIIMVGLYALFGREADSPFLAALLTVIGYSVMDSIVIFDRIRENLKLVTRVPFETVVNQSVLQTMTRSINTLMTVLFTLFALYFFGGETLKNFAFALLVGVTSGAYSSIFIASPLLVIWEKWGKERERRTLATQVSQNGKKGGREPEPLPEEYPEVEAEPVSKRVPRKKQKSKRKRR